MDKSKSRTDLLAAGRKRLQQFRQKKDGKGSGSSSQGKSSKNNVKVEKHDAKGGSVSSDDRSAESSHLIGDEVGNRHIDSSAGHVDPSAYLSADDATPEFDDNKADEPSIIAKQETDSERHDVAFEPNLPVNGAEPESHAILTTTDALVSEEDTDENRLRSAFDHADLSLEPSGVLDVDGSIPNQGVHTTEHEVEANDLGYLNSSKMSTSEKDALHPNSLLPAAEDQVAVIADIHNFPHLSLIRAGEGQVTDLGMVQEADFPCLEKIASSIEIEVDEDRKQSKVLPFAGSEPVSVARNNAVPIAAPEVSTERRINVISMDGEDIQTLSSISDVERSVGVSHGEVIMHVGDLGISFPENGSPRLVQLANYLKELNEDEFKMLMEIRNSDGQAISGNTGIFHEPNIGYVDVLDTYKEHIYVANVLKDIFSVQLEEQSKSQFDTDNLHQQFDYKVSMLENSLEECKERNRSLDEDLVLCQSELRTTLKNVEELSTALHSWKDKYFKSEEDLTIVSNNLFECRSLVENLQLEKENLNGDLKSMLDNMNQHVEEKDNMFKEKEKLILEIGELKRQLADLHLQNSSLTDHNNSAAEKMRKSDDERQSLVQDTIILSSELADCKNLLADAQAKHASASESIIILTEEKNILQSQQHNASLDFEKLTMEVAESRNRLANLEAENQKLSVNLCLEADEMEKLKEENRYLLNKYEVLSSENRAIREELLSERVEKLNLEANKQKVNLWLDRLIEESIFLRICLEMLESKDEECEGANEKQHSVNKRDMHCFLMDPYINGTEGRHIDDAANKGTDVQYSASALQEHAAYLERENIELQVQNEALTDNLQNAFAEYSSMVTMNEMLQKLQLTLKSDYSLYAKKLEDCRLRVSEMHNQSFDIKHNLSETATSILSQMRNMEIEITEALSWFSNHWNSLVNEIIESLERLDLFISDSLTLAEPPFNQGSMEISNRVGTSVYSAISFIKRLQDDFQALRLEYQSLDSLYRELHGSYTNLCKENTASAELLQNLHCGLRSLVTASCEDETGSSLDIEPERLLNPSQLSDYMMLIEQLRKDLHEKMQLKLENAKLCLELDNRIKEMDETRTNNLEMHVIAELVELAEKQLNLTTLGTDSKIPLSSRFGNCISSILQAHKEADGKDNLIKEKCELSEERGSQMQEELERLTGLNIQQENEIMSLRLSLHEAEEQFNSIQTELQRKAAEVEQSEQRVSSIREKLSIAVAKGKGLIVQRDNLKQSLAETSSELEKARQQLQLSDSRLLEAETKLKTYAEAGERVEALESELSYIRNSATALRESFLLKDSVLQRIEEILEDLELPEHLHSREIIDKVDWLARSVVENSSTLPATAWDQKSVPEGDSYVDNSFVEMDAWKGDKHNSDSSDDLRIKHEELQNKFYGLAEQNEMLEQSLMERNSIVQRFEEVLDKINMPVHLRSLEAASQIEWLGSTLSDALQQASAIQESLDHHKTHCEKLIAELEESQKNFTDIKSALESTNKENEYLKITLADLTRNIEDAKERATTLELENKNMQIEIADMQARHLKNNDYIVEVESGARRMLDLLCTALRDDSLIETTSVDCSILKLEEILRRLIDEYTRLSTENIPRENDDQSVENAVSTRDESEEVSYSDHDASNSKTLQTLLEEALGDLTRVKEERDSYIEKHKSLSDEMEVVHKQKEELQHLLNQEEQKSASLREKLNVAVRKGKSLVQQRDSLKQTIEEMNIKVDSLTSDIGNLQFTVKQYEEKCRELSSYAEKVHASESEIQMLRSRLTQMEHYLQEEGRTMSLMIDILNGIQLNSGVNIGDPVEKLQNLGKAYNDLLEAKASSDEESVKSKRAAVLLLAELNEVQERNDALQDELAKVVDELSELSNANQIVEAARVEAVSQFERYSAAQKDEQNKQSGQLVKLRSSVDQFLKFYEDVIHLLADVFSMDLDFFKSLELCMEASDGLHEHGGSLHAEHVDTQKKFFDIGVPAWEKLIACDSLLMYKTDEGFNGSDMDEIYGYAEHQVRNCASNIHCLKERLQSYIVLKAKEASRVSTDFRSVLDEVASRIKSLEQNKETEKNVLLKHIALLYEACADSIHEIGNKKALMMTNSPSFDMRLNVKSIETGEESFSEDQIRALCERLTAAVKDLNNAEQQLLDLSEMKNTIANLQKEIQEKDVQKERICMELVGQIKRAEAAATNYSHDLEEATGQVRDLETQLSATEKDKKLLEQKMKVMEDEKTASVELQERVKSMADMLSAKDQEIESLMQALDEEESELEEMNKRVEQMEMELQQKNKEMGKLENFHNKAMKKLSVTVSKFDELHDLSASLLTEVEKLQLQIQERDKEISFLRQEVTRCTNDILLASQSKKNSDEIVELFEWLKTRTSQVDLIDTSVKDLKLNDAPVYKEYIQNQIASFISELEDLRHVAGSRNEMLQVEKTRVQELMRKHESLETALRQKEAQLNLLEEGPTSSGTGGIETLENNWVAPAPSTSSQVRSLRKSNNDQVAIAIDDDPASSSRLEDEDEDKVHGFKSLTTSRIVPRFTRPVSDMIDGLWVSCDRALMRQPALRLTIILYWALLHALLAAFVV